MTAAPVLAPLTVPATATEPSEPVVAIAHLEHAYGEGELRKQILFDINLTIREGEIVLLTGPSGSGKTTLLTLIGCLRSVQKGSLKVFGQELNGASKATLTQLRRRIGFIFQAHNLLQFLTARQNVQMALELHPHIPPAKAKAMAEAMLAQVGLADKCDSYPHDLSGGQKQRVAIARALVAHPRLILADEPTASLDSKSGREVVDLLQRLAKEQGAAILLVTHDHRILDIADRIVHLEDGCLVQDRLC
ncbi:MAG: DevA family ABC transporter ATP-binding protein [Gloeomargarita sp. SKYBB_i_bin120]|nr:DevA family ABC transporter ATP-binding protein [Gloeomargarita sp. SKYG98]MCS7293271.1 DevA family ABC transporter ATP-binding protein [Gloeomargarita sp. SKYB120]MDW8178836.1 DevA family ABC transporter ATP-binding protein [Gloeomargarita sp. SKYBB_i_bin120]